MSAARDISIDICAENFVLARSLLSLFIIYRVLHELKVNNVQVEQ